MVLTDVPTMSIQQMLAYLRSCGWEITEDPRVALGFCCVPPDKRGVFALATAVPAQIAHDLAALFASYHALGGVSELDLLYAGINLPPARPDLWVFFLEQRGRGCEIVTATVNYEDDLYEHTVQQVIKALGVDPTVYPNDPKQAWPILMDDLPAGFSAYLRRVRVNAFAPDR